MHILIAHNEYGKFSGEEKALQSYDSLLRKNGHAVSWFTRSSSEIGDSVALKFKAALAGVENPYSRREMKSLLKEERPDVVLVQNLYPFLSPSILSPCRELAVPVVMRCPNYRLFCPSGLHMTRGEVCERCLGPGREMWCVLKNCEQNLFKSSGYAVRSAVSRLGRRIVGNVGMFIVLSEFQKKRFVENGIAEDRIIVIPNCAEPISDPITHGVTIAFMGRVAPEKGIEDLLKMARRLPDLPFDVAGEISDSIRHLVEEAPENVRFHGYLRGDRRDAFLREARIVIACSNWFEGFPNVIIEAMAAGKPIVATRIGAIPEIVDDGETGLLYNPGDTQHAVMQLSGLYHNVERCRQLGSAGQSKVMERFTPEVTYEGLLKAIRLAMADPAGAAVS